MIVDVNLRSDAGFTDSGLLDAKQVRKNHATTGLAYHYAVQPLYLPPLASYALLLCSGLPAVLGVSYLFFLACERPFLNTERRETLAETARDAALSPAP